MEQALGTLLLVVGIAGLGIGTAIAFRRWRDGDRDRRGILLAHQGQWVELGLGVGRMVVPSEGRVEEVGVGGFTLVGEGRQHVPFGQVLWLVSEQGEFGPW